MRWVFESFVINRLGIGFFRIYCNFFDFGFEFEKIFVIDNPLSAFNDAGNRQNCQVILCFKPINQLDVASNTSLVSFFTNCHFKGTVAWDGFFAHSIMFGEGILHDKFFGVWAEIRWDKLNFMSIGVFSIYGKILLVHSPNMFIFFKRILHARKNTFGVFGDEFVHLKPLIIRHITVYA